MPQPSCKQEVCLLGLVNYLPRFLPRLTDVAQHLRDLTSKDAKFTWVKQHSTAFKEVKKLVVNHPILKYYDCNAEVTLQCDPSEKGLGTVLLQNGQPVAFASQTLSPTKRRYAQIEKECLAIMFACQRFSQYMSQREKITAESDHKPVQAILKKSLLAAPCRLQRMLLRPQQFNLDVTYKPGSQMYIADHLPRAYLTSQGEECRFQMDISWFSHDRTLSSYQAERVILFSHVCDDFGLKIASVNRFLSYGFWWTFSVILRRNPHIVCKCSIFRFIWTLHAFICLYFALHLQASIV